VLKAACNPRWENLTATMKQTPEDFMMVLVTMAAPTALRCYFDSLLEGELFLSNHCSIGQL
jgi:hypothetical protein